MESYSTRRLKIIRQKAIEKLGGVCQKCGFSDSRALQFDHVDGGGSKQLKHISSMTHCSNILRGAYPDGMLQLLCANCNWIKKYENNELRKTPEGYVPKLLSTENQQAGIRLLSKEEKQERQRLKKTAKLKKAKAFKFFNEVISEVDLEEFQR